MSPPPESQRIASLAALAGDEPPEDSLITDTTRLEMIARAQHAGASWRAIASATGAENGKVAKRDAKRLARRAQKALLRADAAAVPVVQEEGK